MEADSSMIYRGFIRPALDTGFPLEAFPAWLNNQFLWELKGGGGS
ncbi:MAG: hypothetical protein R6U25_08605 [Alkalispirochaeta sp.]